MGLLTFKGGIHPDDGKRFSKDQPIRPVVPQGELKLEDLYLLRSIHLSLVK